MARNILYLFEGSLTLQSLNIELFLVEEEDDQGYKLEACSNIEDSDELSHLKQVLSWE